MKNKESANGKNNLGLLGLALKYLLDRGFNYQADVLNFYKVLDLAVKGRKRMDKYPSICRAFNGQIPISKQSKYYHRKIGI